MLRPPRLPIPAAPARHETLASYLDRLAALHGMPVRELWDAVSSPVQGTKRRAVDGHAMAALTGRPIQHLAAALPQLRDPAPDWAAWRHEPQPGCLRCDARHDGGPVQRLLPHHRYVCPKHWYWIGPPDIGQAATPFGEDLRELVDAQTRHRRLALRHGPAAAFDAVLTGFLVCGHLWQNHQEHAALSVEQWKRRAEHLIPVNSELSRFSASRVFAAVYPEAVALAALIADPAWRSLASGGDDARNAFLTEVNRRLNLAPHYPEDGDPIRHWIKYDSGRPPSAPHKTFPDTPYYAATRPAQPKTQSSDRHERSAIWFAVNRRGGSVLLHHRHIRPVLVREWSPSMGGIAATIWASRSLTLPITRADRTAALR